MIQTTVIGSGTRTATFNTDTISNDGDYLGIKFYLDITAVSGTTPTLDVKLQAFDKLSGKFFDILGASFSQKTASGQDDLIVYPTVAAVANRAVSQPLPDLWRVLATIGGTTPSFTFSLGADQIDPNM